jgi:hypothetical protein
MQRLMKDERGAVAIIVALIMVVLLGFAALAIDVSAAWAEKKQLQNGADAGALAIAQACAKGACGSPSAPAQSLAVENRNSGTATGTVLALTSNSVTVQASDPHEHWFATVLDPDGTTPVGARATAKWGAPIGGGTFPLTFSYCEWQWQQTHGGLDGGVDQIIQLSKHSGSDCTGPSGLPLPGGFGWVDPNAGSCKESSIINGWYTSDTGNTPPSSCSPSDFDALINTTILIPIFDQAQGTGNHGEYHIYGYAAFTFTGYYFAGTYKGTKICTGAQRCISGHFTRYVTLDEALELGTGPSLGASIVVLTP